MKRRGNATKQKTFPTTCHTNTAPSAQMPLDVFKDFVDDAADHIPTFRELKASMSRTGGAWTRSQARKRLCEHCCLFCKRQFDSKRQLQNHMVRCEHIEDIELYRQANKYIASTKVTRKTPQHIQHRVLCAYYVVANMAKLP